MSSLVRGTAEVLTFILSEISTVCTVLILTLWSDIQKNKGYSLERFYRNTRFRVLQYINCPQAVKNNAQIVVFVLSIIIMVIIINGVIKSSSPSLLDVRKSHTLVFWDYLTVVIIS